MVKTGVQVAMTAFLCVSMITASFFGVQYAKVFSASQTGKAKLLQAEHEKQILIEQAKAEVESAKLRAEAIKIVGKVAQEYPEYRTQEFIGAYSEAMLNGSIQKIIYVPTEAGIPILEARKE